MPLTEQETFKTKLQSQRRIVIPSLLRWRYKMESGELLRIRLKLFEQGSYGEESFLAKTGADMRLTVPKLTMEILEKKHEKHLTGAIFEVTLWPAPQETSHSDEAAPQSIQSELLGRIKDTRSTLSQEKEK